MSRTLLQPWKNQSQSSKVPILWEQNVGYPTAHTKWVSFSSSHEAESDSLLSEAEREGSLCYCFYGFEGPVSLLQPGREAKSSA